MGQVYYRDEKGRFTKGTKGGMIGKITRFVEKGTHLHPETEFKPGEFVGDKHPSWKGGVQYLKKDVVYLWDGCNKRVRRSRKVYEEKYGEIPKGYVIFHKDGNSWNDKPGNLDAISRKELMLRNLKKRNK